MLMHSSYRFIPCQFMSCMPTAGRQSLRLSSRLCALRIGSTPTPAAWHARRYFQTLVDSEGIEGSGEVINPKTPPTFGFAFDIDGVLIRGKRRLWGARSALLYLQRHSIPFILLTNGGGMGERQKAEVIGNKVVVPIPVSALVQSHTPFRDMEEYKNKTVLVIGGIKDYCRNAARRYGFKNVIIPSDIWRMHTGLWPFSTSFDEYHQKLAETGSLPKPEHRPISPDGSIKIDAIFVYNDPRDWGLDATLIIDCLLSKDGVLGTLSPKNGNKALPNRGYQQDGQPPLFFSNPDLWWSGAYPLPRLGQGGFRAALEGIWQAVTGGGVELQKTIIGKPHKLTYEYAEKELRNAYESLVMRAEGPNAKVGSLEKVYMIGDNPESDIRGANDFRSPEGTQWKSILLRSGVYSGGEPSVQPTVIQDDVYAGVRWALQDAGWKDLPPELPEDEPEGAQYATYARWDDVGEHIKADSDSSGPPRQTPNIDWKTFRFGEKSKEGDHSPKAERTAVR